MRPTVLPIKRTTVAAGAVIVALLWLGLWPAPAHGGITFTATATAQGQDSYSSGSSLPLGASAQAATPVAQAVLDNLPTSKGYASTLYPGDFAASLPGLVAGATEAPVPAYPAMVTSDAGTAPKSEMGGQGFFLSSSSAEHGTHASARNGAASEATRGGYAEAEALTELAPDGSVRADATSTISGFAVDGDLAFGTVHTTARAKMDGAGRLNTETSIDVTGATINGMSVGFSEGRFVVSGTEQPLPADTVERALAQAGITVTYLAAQDVANGVASPAIQISVTRDGPDGSAAGGTYVTTYTLGRSIVTIESGGTPSSAGATGVVPPAAVPPAAPSGTAGDGAFEAAGAVPTGPKATPGSPSTGVADDGEAAHAATARAPIAIARPPLIDAAPMYLVLALVAVLLVASVQLVRHLGVRKPWTS